MFADCIEEEEDEPACIVTIGGDGTTPSAPCPPCGESGDRNHYSDSWNQPWQRCRYFSETSIEGFEETLKQFSEGDYTIETDRMLKASFKDGREFFALNDFLAYRRRFRPYRILNSELTARMSE